MEGIVDKDELLKLKENMLATSHAIKATKTDPKQFNHGIKSNFLQGECSSRLHCRRRAGAEVLRADRPSFGAFAAPPLSTAELLFPSVYQNPFVIQVSSIELYWMLGS